MADDADSQLAILRFSGELSTKARATRYQFIRRLLHNLRNALESEGIEPRIEVSHDRIFAQLPEAAKEDVLTRIFGVQSVSRAERRSAGDLAAIVRQGEELFRERVRGRRFAVRARRVGNRREGDVRSADIMRDLGSARSPSTSRSPAARSSSSRNDSRPRAACPWESRDGP
jgi:thiamine biosynthesis protein ThiI